MGIFDKDGEDGTSKLVRKLTRRRQAAPDDLEATTPVDGDGSRVEPAVGPGFAEPRAAPAEKEGSTGTTNSGGAPIRHVIQFKGKPVAVGLTWILSGDVGEAREKAVEEAAIVGADVWCLKIEGEPQIGLGTESLGHRQGMPALGAEIASNLPAEWAGIFEIDGCFYVLSARSGAIERDSDIAFVDFDDAVKLFRDLCGRDVTKYYATAGLDARRLGVNGVEEIVVADIIERFVIKLEPLNQTGALLRRYGPYAALALASLVFVFGFPDQFNALRRMVGLGPTDKTVKVTVLPMPWTGQPKASEAIARCLDAFSLIPMGGGGWDGKTARCDGRAVTVTVRRTGSVTTNGAPIGWLKQWLAEQAEVKDDAGKTVLLKPSMGKLSSSGADIVWKLAQAIPRWKEADWPKGGIDDERSRLWEAAERNFEKSSFSNGVNSPYAKTGKMKVVTDLSGARAYTEILKRNTTTIKEMALDLNKFSVTIDVRFHESGGLPKGEPGKTYVHASPKAIETGPVPKPEA